MMRLVAARLARGELDPGGAVQSGAQRPVDGREAGGRDVAREVDDRARFARERLVVRAGHRDRPGKTP